MGIDNFTGRAVAYVAGRPSYPAEAVTYIKGLVDGDAVFADIGAGTGKFTSLVAEFGNTLFAVEPNHDMRAQLQIELEPYEKAHAIEGSAEVTTLGDNCCNVITVAHALHWFDLEKFKDECRRILRPGGLIAIVYNHIPGREEKDLYRAKVDEFFSNGYTSKSFQNPLVYSREKWLAYIYSQDESPLASEPGYAEHLAAVNESFDCEAIDGELHIDRLTLVYTGKI